MTTAHTTTTAAPRTLHAICELTRLAACTCCPADGLDWPCTRSGTGPEGYHLARFAAAMRRGLITGADFTAVTEAAGAFTSATLIYDAPLGGAA
jgi:hypothetical protein